MQIKWILMVKPNNNKNHNDRVSYLNRLSGKYSRRLLLPLAGFLFILIIRRNFAEPVLNTQICKL